MTKTALVTGARGLVGRHLSALLETRGFQVTRIDVAGGVDARDFFREDQTRYTLVAHAAAHVGGRKDIDGRPLFLAARNLTLDGAYFEWALRTRPEHLLSFSSSAAYPIQLQQDVEGPTRLTESDIDLDWPLAADNSYGEVKVMGERLARYAEGEGIRTHVFRPFSGFSDDQSLEYPWPSLVARALRQDPLFEVWGDGRQVRDFIRIDDVCHAIMACVDNDVTGPTNLCTGVGTLFTELATMMCEAAGYKPEFDYKLDAPQGVRFRVGDPTKLHEVYRPRVTIEQAVEEAVGNRKAA